MCIAIPMQVRRCDGTFAWCEGRHGAATIDLALVGRQPEGTWLLTFRGVACEVLAPEDARRTEEALAALQRALAGDTQGIDAAFADLVEREPQLPEHLRAEKAP